jgi:hypothetical protein
VEVTSPASTIVVTSPRSATIAASPSTSTIIAGTSGPVGAQGPSGPPGVSPIFSQQGDLFIKTGGSRYYADLDLDITRVRASVGTPPTGDPVVVELMRNGAVVTEVEIPDGENTAYTNVSEPFTTGDYLTVNIAAVGSLVSGRDLTVTITTT